MSDKSTFILNRKLEEIEIPKELLLKIVEQRIYGRAEHIYQKSCSGGRLLIIYYCQNIIMELVERILIGGNSSITPLKEQLEHRITFLGSDGFFTPKPAYLEPSNLKFYLKTPFAKTIKEKLLKLYPPDRGN